MGKNKLKKFAEMETFSNVFQPPYDPSMVGHWRERYFHSDRPIVLELGCGRGEYTVGLAQKYPDKNFIGVDIKGARMWAGAKQAEQAGLKNVAFLRTQIEFITNFFAVDEIDEIWITFCLYGKSTDGIELFDDAKALQTHYEKQWLDRGFTIKYIEWQLVPLTSFEEPTIEIEHDSYRSYGRNYQVTD